MKKYLVYCFIVCTQTVFGLDKNTLTDWTYAGKHTSYNNKTVSLAIKDFGGIADNKTNNATALNKAIAALNGKPGTIEFGSGFFLFTQPVSLPSFVKLVGQGSDKTSLNFNLNGNSDAISVQGKPDTISSKIINGTQKESTQITVENAGNFAVHDYCIIKQNASNLLNNDWAYNSFYQIVEITAIKGNTISIRSPMHLSFPAQPVLIKINPATDVSIENLTIKRMDITNAQTSTIFFNFAVNCNVSGVELSNSNYALINLQSSAFCTISGNYLHHAFDYGSGGKGYGVVMQFGATDNLIIDNIAEHLRHSFLLQASSNGNVIAFNYSFDPYWKQGFFPSGAAGDIVLHGNYPYGNLFEGNIIQNLVIDNSHGINGPNNTFFRNRMESYGIFMNGNSGDNMNFYANEITGSGLLKGLYSLEGNHTEIANNIKGDLQSGTVSEKSLFNSSYFAKIGINNTYNSWTNEAFNRAKKGVKTSSKLLIGTVITQNNSDVSSAKYTSTSKPKKKKCIKKKGKK